MNSKERPRHRSVLEGMLSVQDAIGRSKGLSVAFMSFVSAYEMLTIFYFLYASVPLEKTSVNLAGRTIKYLQYIQLAAFYPAKISEPYFPLLLPFFAFALMGAALACFAAEVVSEIASEKLTRKTSLCQRFLNIYLPLFSRVFLLNFLSATLGPLLSTSLNDSSSSSSNTTILHFISRGVGVAGLVLLVLQAAYVQLFLKNKNEFADPNFASCSFSKQLVMGVHKAALVVVVTTDIAYKNAPAVSFINLILAVVYVALNYRHLSSCSPTAVTLEAAIDITLANGALHLFLMDLTGGYCGELVMAINFVFTELLAIYCLSILKRKRLQVELHRDFEAKSKKKFTIHVRKVIRVAESGRLRDRISVLSDFAAWETEDHAVLFGWVKDRSSQISHTFSVLTEEFSSQIVHQIYSQLEKYLERIAVEGVVGPDLKFLLVRLLLYRRNKQLQSLTRFFELESEIDWHPPSFDLVCGHFNFRKSMERFLEQRYSKGRTVSSLQILEAQRYNVLFERFVGRLGRCVDAFEKVWVLLQDDAPQVEDLIAVSKSLYAETQATEGAFEVLTQVATPTYLCYKLYFAFVNQVLCDSQKAASEQENFGITFRKRRIQLRSVDLNVPQMTPDSRKNFLLLDGTEKSLGIVRYMSADLRTLFRQEPSHVVGKPLGDFMPLFLQSFYVDWIQKFFGDPRVFDETLTNRQHFSFFLDSGGYFVTTLCNLRLLLDFNEGIRFALFVTPVALHSSPPNPPLSSLMSPQAKSTVSPRKSRPSTTFPRPLSIPTTANLKVLSTSASFYLKFFRMKIWPPWLGEVMPWFRLCGEAIRNSPAINTSNSGFPLTASTDSKASTALSGKTRTC